MNLVDSSGWLEYFDNSKNSKYFAPVIEDTDNLIVSVINVYEVYKKILIERGEKNAIEAAGFMYQSRIVEVSLSLSIIAAKISQQHKIPMADSLIYATAIQNEAILWTQDKDFKNLDNVKFIEKR